jgi:hypothetical protein
MTKEKYRRYSAEFKQHALRRAAIDCGFNRSRKSDYVLRLLSLSDQVYRPKQTPLMRGLFRKTIAILLRAKAVDQSVQWRFGWFNNAFTWQWDGCICEGADRNIADKEPTPRWGILRQPQRWRVIRVVFVVFLAT